MDMQWGGVERRGVVNRRKRKVYRFWERRGGFDRRRRSVLLGSLLEHPALLAVALVALNALSLIDGFYTAVGISAGVAREGNPVLVAAANRDPLLAVAVKVGSMGFVTAMIWCNRRRKTILVTGLAALAGYAVLVAYHRWALSQLGLL
ncbi:MAG: DUF5658 family protein [Coriobacteriia bacterium]